MVAHIAVQTKSQQGIISIMPFRLTPIIPVLLGILSAQAALGIMTPLIPLLLVAGRVSTPIIGLIASAYFVGLLAGALSCDRVVRSVGHIRAFAVFAAAAADGALMMGICARMLQRSEVPREQRSVFVPAPAAPAHHSELAAHGGRPRTSNLIAAAEPAD